MIRSRVSCRLLLAGILFPAVALSAEFQNVAPMISGSFGPALAAGDGSKDLKNGLAFQLEAAAQRSGRNGWLFRASYQSFDRDAIDRAISMWGFEVGLRRGRSFGAIRPYLEGLAGASWTDEKFFVAPVVQNDRLYTPPPSRTRSREIAPMTTVGAGFEVRAPANIALAASAAARWSPVRNFAGPVFPVDLGLTWPSYSMATDAAAPGGPRLRLAAGSNFLRTPQRLRGHTDAGLSVSADLDVPIRDWLSFSLGGEHALQRSRTLVVVRQERDEFGNLVNVYGSAPLSLTATALTAGLRASIRVGWIAPYLRGGIGWGRTGGFGRTDQVVTGAYIDPHGNWVPVYQDVTVGAGSPRAGLAYSGTAGIEAPIKGSLHAFVESGVLGLQLRGEDALVLPQRAGVVLR